MMDWQPIDTAPNTVWPGVFLLRDGTAEVAARFVKEGKVSFFEQQGPSGGDYLDGWEELVTHWMPLPAPPSQEQPQVDTTS